MVQRTDPCRRFRGFVNWLQWLLSCFGGNSPSFAHAILTIDQLLAALQVT
jgi:hypothetical protein